MVSAQITPGGVHSVIRPGALNDIPQHLTEIGWDTDAPSLFAIRYLPGENEFRTGLVVLGHRGNAEADGFHESAASQSVAADLRGKQLFCEYARRAAVATDLQAFQAWCMRRAQVIPPILVHTAPYLPPFAAGQTARVLPLGLPPGQSRENQSVDGVVTETFIGGGCKPVMSGWIDLQ